MTAGSYPPGSDRGKNFVHDPKMAKEPTVYANAKLQFVGNDNKRYILSRTVEAKKTAKQVSIKALDSTLTFVDETGQRKSISGKVVDINKEIMRILGVTEPILNYVIFCHQEDSNWPMEEGSKVKQKFDEIFSAEKYNALLKHIKDLRLSQKTERDKNAIDVKHYSDVAKETDKKERELKDLKNQNEEYESFMAAQNEQLEKVRDQLKGLNEIEQNYGGLFQKHAAAKSSLKHAVDDIEELKNNLRGNIMADITEIENEQAALDNESQNLQVEKDQLSEDLNQLKRQLSREKKTHEEIRDKVSKGKAQHEIHEQNEKNLESIVRDAAKHLEWDLPNDITSRYVEEALENIEDTLNTYETDKASIETNFQEKFEANQNELNQLNLDKAKLGQKKESLTEARMKKNRELAMVKKTLSELKGSSEKLAELKTKLENKDKELKDVQNSINLEELDDNIDKKSENVKELNETLKKLRQELSILSKQRDLYSQLSMKEKELNEKKEKCKKLMNKINGDLEIVFEGNVPKLDQMKKSFDKVFKERDNQKSQLEEEKLKLETSAHHDSKNLDKLLDQIKSDELRIKNFEQQLGNLNSIDSFDEDLKTAKENVEKTREELQVKEANKHTFKQFIEKMEKSKHCPTCKRGFDQDKDCEEVIEFLKEEIQNVPSKVKYIQSRLKEALEIEAKFEKLRPEKISCLDIRQQLEQKNNEIEDLKNKLKDDKKRLKGVKEELEALDEILQACTIRDDVFQIDNLNNENKKIEHSIEELQKQLGNANTGKNYDEVKQEEELKTQELETLREDLEDLKSKKSDYESKINRLQRERNSFYNEKLTLEGRQQDRANIETKKADLEKEIANDDKDIKKIQRDMQPLEDQVQVVLDTKETLVKNKDQTLSKLNPKIVQVSSYKKDIQQIQEQVKDYEKSGKAAKLKNFKKDLVQAQTSVQDWEQKEKSVNEKIVENEKKALSKQSRQRTLQDNMKLQDLTREKSEYEEKVSSLEKRLQILGMVRVKFQK